MSFAYTASGGALPYTFALASGVLPDGISLNAATGALTGTYAAAGTFAWVVRVTDAVGSTTTLADTCTVTEPPFLLRGVAWNMGSKQLTVFDGDTDAVVATVAVPETAANILTNISDCRIRNDGTRAYVLSRGDNALYQINLETDTAASLVTGLTDGGSFDVSRDGAFAYVTGGAVDKVFKVNLATAAIVADPTLSGFVWRCELSPDDQFLYVASLNSPFKVRKLATSSMSVVATSSADVVAPEDIAVSADGAKVYVVGSHAADNDITAFNASDLSVAASANYAEPFSVLADDSGTYVYLLHADGAGGATLRKLNATTLASVGTVAAGKAWNTKMAFAYDYTRIFIGDSDQAGVTDPVIVIDPFSMVALPSIAAKENPSGLAASGTATVLGSNTTPLAIPDNNGFVSSDIVIAGAVPASQSRLAISVHLTHSYRGDLELIVDRPDGGSTTLVSPDSNDNGDGFVRSFSLGPGVLLVNGTWTLRIRDTAAFDTGTLDYWKVIKVS